MHAPQQLPRDDGEHDFVKLIGLTPVGRSVGIQPETTISIAELSRDPEVFWACRRGYDIARVRNELLEMALADYDFDYALFLDADNVTRLRDLIHAVELLGDAAVLAGHYKLRAGDGGYVSAQRRSNTTLRLEDLINQGEPFVVDRVAGGCMLLNLQWFRQNWSKRPWFVFEQEVNSPSEDYWFSDKLRERGGTLLFHPRWFVGHVDVRRGSARELEADLLSLEGT